MTHPSCDKSEITMKYRLQAKLINRGLIFLLVFLVLTAFLLVLQAFYHCESLHADSSISKGHTILPYLGQQPSDDKAHSNILRSQILSESSRFADSRYNPLKEYHNKGLTFRAQFDCRRLFQKDSIEQEKVARFHKQNRHKYHVVDSEKVPDITADCEAFKTIRGYRTDEGSSAEREFPLAYVILVHADFEHLERLLRTIYMPQHSICIHVDKKAPESLKTAVSSLTKCFSNIILASNPLEIVYAHMSRLQADIVCMGDLLKHSKSWRYLINYAATEFPLRTNLEIVEILKVLNGLNDVHEQFSRRLEDRFKKEYEVVGGRMKQTQTELPPPPYNMTIVKGQAYNTFSRAFVEWLFSDEKPRRFLEWSNKTYSPDEHYWATLNDLYHNPFLKTPGGFKGHPDKKGYITRLISWQYSKPKFKCHGKTVRNICIFSALDLHIFLNEMHLAVNKFDLTFDPVAYSCMEELLHNKTLAQLPFNLQYYSKLYFVTYGRSTIF